MAPGSGLSTKVSREVGGERRGGVGAAAGDNLPLLAGVPMAGVALSGGRPSSMLTVETRPSSSVAWSGSGSELGLEVGVGFGVGVRVRIRVRVRLVGVGLGLALG